MLCVVIPEVEDGDFSHFEGFGVERSLERKKSEKGGKLVLKGFQRRSDFSPKKRIAPISNFTA